MPIDSSSLEYMKNAELELAKLRKSADALMDAKRTPGVVQSIVRERITGLLRHMQALAGEEVADADSHRIVTAIDSLPVGTLNNGEAHELRNAVFARQYLLHTEADATVLEAVTAEIYDLLHVICENTVMRHSGGIQEFRTALLRLVQSCTQHLPTLPFHSNRIWNDREKLSKPFVPVYGDSLE